MKFQGGYSLGPYKIVAPIGAGGMGEVYRAKDPRLEREVAIKVLPAEYSSDPERLRRFEQEAKAAGILNHPNILSVYDIGTHDGCPYVVSELLVGETLRERLGGSALSTRKSVEYALQIAHGLAAAHDKGIVHRDLKPENIFITRDGRIKILDFGLAKLTIPEPVSGGKSRLATIDVGTQPGMVLGTIGYMSPEQVRGREVDHRSDLFSFGAILYEMVTGKRAFQRDSTADTMSAILKEEPVDPSSTNKTFPSALERIIRHCLEKNAEERFQSARDLAFDLEMISGISGATLTEQRIAPADIKKSRRLPLLLTLLFLVGALVGSVAAIWITRALTKSDPPSFQRLTFRRGYLSSARFAPDRQTILYSASWSGAPSEIFSTRPQSPVSRSLNLPTAELLSISSTGEMAILLDARFTIGFQRNGTLARVAIDGGAPRAILDNAQDADWTPDGKQLAVIRNTPIKRRIEFPIGKVIYETAGWISNIRFSPDGRMLAALEHPGRGDDRGMVIVMDLEGKKKVLTEEWTSESGLAWSPDGKEIWFTSSLGGSNQNPLRAVTLEGKQRMVSSMAGNLILHDVLPTGEVLLAQESRRREMMGQPPGEKTERDLSWMDWSFPRDISDDGKHVLFEEQGAGAGQKYSVYLRATDGSAAVRLGDGYSVALSPDGKSALAGTPGPGGEVMILPTGAGQPKKLEFSFETNAGLFGSWLRDSNKILISSRGAGGAQLRCWIYEVETGKTLPLTPEGVGLPAIISADEKFVLANCVDGGWCTYSVPNGQSKKVNGLTDGDVPIAESKEPQWFYVSNANALPNKIDMVNVFTGERRPWKVIIPPDLAGVQAPVPVIVTPDGSAYVYTYRRILSDLYLAKGIK